MMKVLLQHPLPNLGFIGDVVKVKPGYARNYLLPRGYAILANEQNAKHYKHIVKLTEVKKKKAFKEAQEQATHVATLSLTIKKTVGEDDKIFGSVTTGELVQEFQKLNLNFDRKQLKIIDEIKRLGVYKGSVRFHPEVEAEFKIWVVSDKA